MDFNNVIEKYGYDEYLGSLLASIYESQIKFFGDESEEIIYKAYLDTKVYKGNCYTVGKELGFVENSEEGLVKEGDLKRAAGVYFTKPILEFDGVNYVIKEIKRAVIINSFDIKSISAKGTIAHELSHLVKGYYKEYEIVGNILIERSGFIERHYELSQENGVVKTKMIDEKNVGIEEGFNSVLEEEIMHDMGYPDYKVSGYGVVNQIAKNYLKMESFDLFLRSEFYKDNEEIIERFSDSEVNYFEGISMVTDQIYQATLEMFANLFNSEKVEELSQKQRQLIKEVYLPLINSISKVRKV